MDKVIEMNPKYFNAYYNRGNLKSRIGDCNGAIADLNEAIKMTPYLPYAFFLRGLCKKQINDYSGALKDYDKAIEYDSLFVNISNVPRTDENGLHTLTLPTPEPSLTIEM